MHMISKKIYESFDDSKVMKLQLYYAYILIKI